MKPLSERQARDCEEARKPKCRCRCNGALHGARRAGLRDYGWPQPAPREWFEQLPADDPHYLPPEPEAVRELRRMRQLSIDEAIEAASLPERVLEAVGQLEHAPTGG